jgi:hypothetical protein
MGGRFDRVRRRAAVIVAFASLGGATAAACSSRGSSASCGFGCGSDASTPTDGPSLLGTDAHPPAKALAIDPASSTLLVTVPSNPPSAQLAAKATYEDGSTRTVAASWTVDRYDIASIGTSTGLFVPTASVFGKATVTAKALGLTATTSVTVSLDATVNMSNVPAADGSLLASTTTPDPAVQSLAYPYDKTVFPEGLVPPQIMWNLGSPGDEYLLHFVAPSFDLSVLTTADPPSRFALSQTLWNSLVATAAGGSVTVELRRFSAGVAYLSATESWTIAAADLRGLVYYWSISQGQILAADPTVGTVTTVFTPGFYTQLGNPPPLEPADAGPPNNPPWENNGTGDRCVACHSVSKDGSTLTAVFSTGGSEGPLGFVGLQSTNINAIGD